jgi:hypothetical protein
MDDAHASTRRSFSKSPLTMGVDEDEDEGAGDGGGAR